MYWGSKYFSTLYVYIFQVVTEVVIRIYNDQWRILQLNLEQRTLIKTQSGSFYRRNLIKTIVNHTKQLLGLRNCTVLWQDDTYSADIR